MDSHLSEEVGIWICGCLCRLLILEHQPCGFVQATHVLQSLNQMAQPTQAYQNWAKSLSLEDKGHCSCLA